MKLPPACPWSPKRVQNTMRRLKRVMTAPPLRLPGEPQRPPDDAPPTVWSVFLGCNTPKRLMEEMGIGYNAALARLHKEREAGWIFCNGGRWQVKCVMRKIGA